MPIRLAVPIARVLDGRATANSSSISWVKAHLTSASPASAA